MAKNNAEPAADQLQNNFQISPKNDFLDPQNDQSMYVNLNQTVRS